MNRAVDVSTAYPRRSHTPVGWRLALVVFVVLPLLAATTGNWLLFHIFGNGHTIAPNSPGYSLLSWWSGLGREGVVALAAAALLFARRISPARAVGFATLAGLCTFVWWFLFFLLAAFANPAGLG